jgi:hypothetical protein
MLKVPLRKKCITVAVFNNENAFLSEVKTAVVEAEDPVHLQAY